MILASFNNEKREAFFVWWLNFFAKNSSSTPCIRHTTETWGEIRFSSSHFSAYRLCNITWHVLLFLVWLHKVSTTASNTISLWACLWEKIWAYIYISTLHTQNCQIRTKDSVWAHCVTVRGLQCPAGQAASKLIAISIISLKMAFLQDTRHSHKVHNLNLYRINKWCFKRSDCVVCAAAS